MSTLTTWLTELGPVALLVLMGLVFAETGLLVGFFLPGDSLLFAVGVLVAAGALAYPLWLVVLLAAVAAVLGDQVGYLLGRRFGPRVFSRSGSRVLDPRHAERAQAFFAQHGPKAVILARFVPVVRTFTPTVAGVGRMSRRRFTAYNVVGAVAWTTLMVLGGYFLGGVPLVADHIEVVSLVLVALSLVPAGLSWWRERRRAGGEPTRRVPTATASTPIASPATSSTAKCQPR